MKLSKTTGQLFAALCLSMTLMPVNTVAKSNHDLGKPFGFCTRTSRTDSSSACAYNVTGGGTFSYPIPETIQSVKVLKSNGGDMKNTIKNAIKKYSVVVLDGSAGDFIVSSKIELRGLTGRTVIDYISQHLLMEASYLLRTTSLSITQIADQLHFADAPSFSKFFSRKKGITPKDYRAR